MCRFTTKLPSLRGLVFKAGFSLALLTVGGTGMAQEAVCRQSLSLGLDVSGSVDAGEYRMQLEGIAQALTDPEVMKALVVPGAAPVALHVFEWSGPEYQRVLQDWAILDSRAAVFSLAETLVTQTRAPAPPSTALGTAVASGARYLSRGPDCWKKTLDISGDGTSNTGPRPQDLDDLPALEGVTVNALVILTQDRFGQSGSDGDLLKYFETLVIRGPDAFALPAQGFEDYARAMKEKLLREIKALAVGVLGAPHHPKG